MDPQLVQTADTSRGTPVFGLTARNYLTCISKVDETFLSQAFPSEPNKSQAKMKRKLNENDVPQEVSAELSEVSSTASPAISSFSNLGLDPRLLQAVTKQKFSAPTSVQAQAIPLALAGKDILGRLQSV